MNAPTGCKTSALAQHCTLPISTGSNGVADFRVGNARSGHYNIIVHSITSPGAVYEPLLNATDPGFDVP